MPFCSLHVKGVPISSVSELAGYTANMYPAKAFTFQVPMNTRKRPVPISFSRDVSNDEIGRHLQHLLRPGLRAKEIFQDRKVPFALQLKPRSNSTRDHGNRSGEESNRFCSVLLSEWHSIGFSYFFSSLPRRPYVDRKGRKWLAAVSHQLHLSRVVGKWGRQASFENLRNRYSDEDCNLIAQDCGAAETRKQVQELQQVAPFGLYT